MTPPDTAILHDQQRIRDVILRYFAGLDRKDPALFDEVFQPDAVMTALAGGRTFHGREEIARSLMTVRDYEHTAHFPTSQLIEVSGDAARADTFGIAYIVLGGTEQKVIVRGLQYLDDLVRTEAGWRIAHRQHIPLWQSDLDRAPLLLPSQPVKG